MDCGLIPRKARGSFAKGQRVERYMAVDLDLDLIWALGLRSNGGCGSSGSGGGAGFAGEGGASSKGSKAGSAAP